MARRFRVLSVVLLSFALAIVLLPGAASSGGLPPSFEPDPTPLYFNPNGTATTSGFDNQIWITTTVGTDVDLSDIEPLPPGNPKLGTSLNQLLVAYRRNGLAGAQDFADQHVMLLDAHRVQVEVVADGEAMAGIRETVEALGGEYQGHYETLLQALVPIDALESLAEQPDVWFVRDPRRAIALEPTLVGAQTTSGVAASNASAWHLAGYDGSGVKIAVVDAGFAGYAALLGTDLPVTVQARD